MTRARAVGVLAAFIAADLISGCARQKLDPPRPGQAVVVLLPDDDGTTGRARVSNPKGGVELDAAREATIAVPNRKPGSVRTMSEADIKRIFGEALVALPPSPKHFTLFFRFESDELTDDSRALFPEILKTVKEHTVPDVVVVGHTDTMGTRTANAELGLRRATMVRNMLVDAGLDGSTIEVTSHGEGDLLVRTVDETAEPRNRRVEISVK
jgi:outer membrane protein OmpA-like peptidoglycan-associated protein